jgi:2,5-furandicarboxylate decarboxylase 1
MTRDLRTFLADVAAADPASIRVVGAPVDPRFQITAYGAAAARDGEHPVFFFPEVVGSSMACVSNLVATHERLGLALGMDPDDLRAGSSDLGASRQAHPPVEVAPADAPVKEVVLTGDDVRLSELPIPTHNELDGGPFLTAAVGIMRDPHSGAINAGIYRHHIYDDRTMGVWFFGSHHGGTIHRRYSEMGQDTPIALAIGHHPAFLMGAVSRVPGIGGEYDAAGAFLGEPVEVVAAETSDLLVPAAAEIVIEGRIVHGRMSEEGPFAEWPGHYVGGGLKPIIEVDAITHRRGAIFQDIQASGEEHRLMGALPRVASIFRNVSQVVPGLKAVSVPTHARMHCYLSIRKEHDNDVTRAAFAALNTEPENLRMIVVVDDDIDVNDHRELAWAVGTRFDAERDLQIVPGWNGPGGLLPTTWEYDTEGGRTARRSSATIIDATKPAPPVVFPARARVPEEVVAAVDLAVAAPFTPGGVAPWAN